MFNEIARMHCSNYLLFDSFGGRFLSYHDSMIIRSILYRIEYENVMVTMAAEIVIADLTMIAIRI